MKYREFRSMNTDILMAAEGKDDAIETGFRQAQAFIQAGEKRFTRFHDESELSRLNRAAGTWFDASQDLYDVVTLAYNYHLQTEGLFDPSVLGALEQAGYDRSMEAVRMRTSSYAPAATLARVKPHEFSELRTDPDGKRIWLPPEVRIDLGGIAKGWIAERAAKLLANYAKACVVDAGGDAFFVGYPANEKTWRITLEDPGDPERGLAVLKLGPGAVATSAITKRRWQQGGKTQHHLIDPRTQRSADTDWLSVTVIAPYAAEAEVFAKSLLIGGSYESQRIAEMSGRIEFIAVDGQGKLWGSRHSKDYLDVTNQQLH
jgi:thiamine biosynthesis lipoprotein